MKARLVRLGKVLRAARAEGSAPVTAERDLFRALGSGSLRLLRPVWSWVVSADGTNKLWNLLMLLWGVAALGWLVAQVPLLLPVVVVVWCAAALRHGAPRTPPAEIVYETGEQPAEPSPEPLPAPTDADLIGTLTHLIGDRNGSLLRTVVEQLHEAGVDPEWGIPELRSQCAVLGIPVRPALKTPQGTSPGVHRDDFLATLSTLANRTQQLSPGPLPDQPPGTGSFPNFHRVTSDNYPPATS